MWTHRAPGPVAGVVLGPRLFLSTCLSAPSCSHSMSWRVSTTNERRTEYVVVSLRNKWAFPTMRYNAARREHADDTGRRRARDGLPRAFGHWVKGGG